MKYLLYILIIIIDGFIILISKNHLKSLNIISLANIISGIVTLFIGYILKILINSKITIINLSIVSSAIFAKFLMYSLFLLGKGIILRIYLLIKKRTIHSFSI